MCKSDNPPQASAASPAPDDILEIKDATGMISARASLWWSRTPDHGGMKTGMIGGFEASNGEAALCVLDKASDRLRGAGADLAVGPMDGNTWRRYRWMVESDGRGPFFLEPWNPPEYPQWWKDAGLDRKSVV